MSNRRGQILAELLLTFMKIGFFTFGGGYAMIAVLEDSCVEKRRWITHDEMMDVTVIAESTPGPIAINCATYVGYRQAGLIGAIVATIGINIPSFLVIYINSMFLDDFLEIEVIANAFNGIRLAVGILILDAAFNMIRKMKQRVFPRIVMVSSFVAMLLIDILAWNFSSISLMLIAAAISLALFVIDEGRMARR